MARKTGLKKALPLLLLAALSVAAGVTGAAILHSLTLKNPIKTPSVEGEPEEILGDTKKVRFVNNGEADVFLRAVYTESWVYQDGQGETILLPNLAEKTDGSLVRAAQPKLQDMDNWYTESDDGWWYYKKILPGTLSGKKEDDLKTNWLVDGVALPSEDGGADSTVKWSELQDERYRDASYQLHFTMEVVQASGDPAVSEAAVLELFHKVIDIDGDWGTDGKYQYEIGWTQDSKEQGGG